MKITLAPALAFHQMGKRGNQEDSLYPSANALHDGEELSYFIVCDGVGGAEKGEVASSIVAQSLGEIIKNVADVDASIFAKAMTEVYTRLERTMRETGIYDMATTLTFVKFDNLGIFAAHIGDSRIYHIRPGAGVLYRSDDHSLVNAMVKAGIIKEEEAETHPQRNVITRCVNHVNPDGDPPRATTHRITDVQPGDWMVACSDGVLHCVSDNKLVEILSDTGTSDVQKRDELAKLSINSSDNNTLYMARVLGVELPLPDADEGVDLDVEITLLRNQTHRKHEKKNWLQRLFKK